MKLEKLLERFKNRQLIIDALALLFGIGAIIGANSVFLQLPLLVNDAPEGWKLPTDMTLVTQLGNIGPIVYSIYMKYCSRKRDHWLIYGMTCGGAAAIFALAFLHQETFYIFGAERSVALLGFLYVVAFTACTASLLFVPYMKYYREIYIVSYLVGEGLSGFIPSILALMQGVGGNPQCVNATDPNSETPFVPVYPEPNFSTSTFFVVIGIILVLSFVAFVALTNVPADSPERAVVVPEITEVNADVQSIDNAEQLRNKMPWKTHIYLQVMMGLASAITFVVVPSLQSYASLPYGNVAYHLAVTLSWMVNTLVMCFGFFIKNPRIDVLNYVMAGIFALTSFVTYLALASPSPPLQHTLIGEFLVVIIWVVLNGLIGFVRLTITTLFRKYPGKELFYCGVATQIGTFSGAVMCFCVMNFTGIFVSYSPCTDPVIVGFS